MKQKEKLRLENRSACLTTRHSRLCEMYHDDYSADNPALLETIVEIENELDAIKQSLDKRREYLFNFIGGGWNSETAYYEEEAIEQALFKYGHPDTQEILRVDVTTFRVSTPADYQAQLSNFY